MKNCFNGRLNYIGELHSRLFDHRPAVNSESLYFLREFEEKRNDREVNQLFSTLENFAEIRDSQLEKMKVLADLPLKNVIGKFETALSMSDQIMEETNEEDKVENFLVSRREQRTREWNDFMLEMAKKRTQVIRSCDEKEEMLQKHYFNLEQKLKTHRL